MKADETRPVQPILAPIRVGPLNFRGFAGRGWVDGSPSSFNLLRIIVSNVIASGRQLVGRTVLLQAVCAVGVGALFALASMDSAKSAVVGGLVVTAGNAILGQRMFAAGVAPASTLLSGALVGLLLKWLWLVLAIGFSLAVLRLQPLPLIIGVMMSYAAFGLATLRFR